MKTYLNFVNGNWVPSATGRTFTVTNPADTSDVVGEFQRSNEADVAAAVAAAKAALPEWNRLTLKEREECMFRAADEVLKRADEIARACTREMGKPLAGAKGEISRAVEFLHYYGGEARRCWGKTSYPDAPGYMLYTLRKPIGVVGLINPWNFPIATPIGKLTAALAYGNTVVVKLPKDAPMSGLIMAECFEAAGFPRGVINYLTGSGSEVGDPLVEHPDVRGITFTGSTEVGSAIRARCGMLGKRVQLEMGGHNPVVIMGDADLERATKAASAGAFSLTGQRCTATRRALIQRSVYDQCVEMLIEQTKTMRVGNGFTDGVTIGPVINSAALDSILAAVDDATSKGARLLYGGHRLTDGDYSKGYFMEPTLLSEVTPDMEIVHEEVFGPVLTLIPFDTPEEGLAGANAVRFGLATAIYTTSLKVADSFIKGAEAGVVHVNDPTFGSSVHAPFGGLKESGFGPHEQGDSPMEFFTETRTIFLVGK